MSHQPVTGKGKTPDKAVKDANRKADAGTYEATITATVEADKNKPEPTPIGDYRAQLTPK